MTPIRSPSCSKLIQLGLRRIVADLRLLHSAASMASTATHGRSSLPCCSSVLSSTSAALYFAPYDLAVIKALAADHIKETSEGGMAEIEVKPWECSHCGQMC